MERHSDIAVCAYYLYMADPHRKLHDAEYYWYKAEGWLERRRREEARYVFDY